MKGIITNVLGEVEIDPHNCKFAHDKWMQSITRSDGSIDLHTFGGISPTASELVTQYIFDLFYGKNLSKGAKKGRRSYQHLVNTRNRLRYLIDFMEKRYNKQILEVTEDEVIKFFNAMRESVIIK